MSRSRWVVLLGPPLIVAAAAGILVGGAPDPRVRAGALPIPRVAAACPEGTVMEGRAPAAVSGAWWRSSAVIDAAGTLTGWRLIGGREPGAGTVRLDLPAASSASGPDRGRIFVAADDGTRSTLTILDLARGCERVVDLGVAVARRAIADPLDGGAFVHLLDRMSRADLGIWHVDARGLRSLVLATIDNRTLEAAGVERVWATNLVSSRDGRRLAVQSCDPDACVTRVLERGAGRVTTLLGDQGDLVGFAGTSLITMAACGGLPCDVIGWASTGPLAGSATIIARATIGAAVVANGRVVIAIPHAASGSFGARAIAIDPDGRSRHDLGDLPGDAVPLSSASRSAGIEVGPAAIAVIDGSGLPSLLEVQP